MAGTRIPHLPNEILYEIAGYVDDEDILNLRLSAKVFQYVTADRFATTFFETREHRLSLKGVKSLLKITEHPVLVRHIRAVIIGHDGKQRPAKYHDLFEQIFQNLASVGNGISLGLRPMCDSDQYDFSPYFGSRYSGSDHMVKFFEEKILAVAIRAQMPLNNLVSDVRGVPSDPISWVSPTHMSFLALLWRRASTRVTGFSQFSGLHIKLSPRASDFSRSGKIFVEPHRKRLEISHIHISDFLSFPRDFTDDLREIHLESSDADYRFLRGLLHRTSHQLEHLSLYDIRMKPLLHATTEATTWKSIFVKRATTLNVLKSCKFGKLWTTSNRLWLKGGDKTIEASTRAQVITVLSNLSAGVRTFELDG
ncbi:hypothetical protein KCU78_g13212, partial [Aureobasidium melanogenum]